MTDSKRIKELMREKHTSCSEIAKKLGTSGCLIEKKINNDAEFRYDEIIFICKILKIEDLKERNAIFFVDYVEKMPTYLDKA